MAALAAADRPSGETMKYASWSASLLAVMLLLGSAFAPAHAQATRTWVSGTGDDANPCSRTAPCKTFAGAISKTAAGGEINCLDAGGYGGVTITKSITIDCVNTEAGVVVAGTNGVVVNAGATDVIMLRGLDLFGTVATPALNGIRFLAGAALHVEKSVIRRFLAGGTDGFGILFAPSGASELYVTDTYLTANGTGSTGGAIMIRPTGSGSAKATFNNVHANNNVTGFTANTLAGPTSGNILMTVHRSITSGNTLTGIAAIAGASGGQAVIIIDHSASINNATGISVQGAFAGLVVGQSTISGNVTGLNNPGGTGGINTFGTNQLTNNTTDGAFTAPVIPLR